MRSLIVNIFARIFGIIALVIAVRNDAADRQKLKSVEAMLDANKKAKDVRDRLRADTNYTDGVQKLFTRD